MRQFMAGSRRVLGYAVVIVAVVVSACDRTPQKDWIADEAGKPASSELRRLGTALPVFAPMEHEVPRVLVWEFVADEHDQDTLEAAEFLTALFRDCFGQRPALRLDVMPASLYNRVLGGPSFALRRSIADYSDADLSRFAKVYDARAHIRGTVGTKDGKQRLELRVISVQGGTEVVRWEGTGTWEEIDAQLREASDKLIVACGAAPLPGAEALPMIPPDSVFAPLATAGLRGEHVEDLLRTWDATTPDSPALSYLAMSQFSRNEVGLLPTVLARLDRNGVLDTTLATAVATTLPSGRDKAAAWDMVANTYPKSQQAWAEAGWAHRRLRANMSAEQRFLRALELSKANWLAHANLADHYHFIASHLFLNSDRNQRRVLNESFTLAIPLFEESLAINPMDYRAIRLYAQKLHFHGKMPLEETLRELEKSLALSPEENQEAIFQMVWICSPERGNVPATGLSMFRRHQHGVTDPDIASIMLPTVIKCMLGRVNYTQEEAMAYGKANPEDARLLGELLMTALKREPNWSNRHIQWSVFTALQMIDSAEIAMENTAALEEMAPKITGSNAHETQYMYLGAGVFLARSGKWEAASFCLGEAEKGPEMTFTQRAGGWRFQCLAHLRQPDESKRIFARIMSEPERFDRKWITNQFYSNLHWAPDEDRRMAREKLIEADLKEPNDWYKFHIEHYSVELGEPERARASFLKRVGDKEQLHPAELELWKSICEGTKEPADWPPAEAARTVN